MRRLTPAIRYQQVPAQITAKERDIESGLDFFNARYFSSAQGRFCSVDPITVTPARVLDPQQLNLYAYVRNNPLAYVDPTGMVIDTSRLDEDELKRWQKIVELASRRDASGNYVNSKLHEVYQQLQDDKRTFFIENFSFGEKSGALGRFQITKFSGSQDFSEAVLQLDFKKVRSLSSTSAAEFVSGFNKFEGLLGRGLVSFRDAELFGHEGAHGVYSLDNISESVRVQLLLNDRDAALKGLPKGTKFPYPPDIMKKMLDASRGVIPTERFAEQTEKIINGELRATLKRK